MTNPSESGSARAAGSGVSRRAEPADIIVDPCVRAGHDRFVSIAGNIHPDVTVSDGGVETRVEFDGRLLCRLVPYRELVHVLVGDRPSWEARIRGPEGFHEAAARLVDTFLRMVADAGETPKAEPRGDL